MCCDGAEPPAGRPFQLDRFITGRLIDEAAASESHTDDADPLYSLRSRDESEFACAGQRTSCGRRWSKRPSMGEYLSSATTQGLHFERWRHAQGCGQWFNVVRNTVTHEILSVYAITDPPPA